MNDSYRRRYKKPGEIVRKRRTEWQKYRQIGTGLEGSLLRSHQNLELLRFRVCWPLGHWGEESRRDFRRTGQGQPCCSGPRNKEGAIAADVKDLRQSLPVLRRIG